MLSSFNFSSFSDYIDILKPVCHGGHLPSSIDMSDFIANNKPVKSNIIPYICHGGNIILDSSCLFQIHNPGYYILLHIKSGQCRISNNISIASAATGSVIIFSNQADFIFESLTAHSEYSLYILTGTLLDEYWSCLCRPGFLEAGCNDYFIHYTALSPKYILDMTSNLNNMLSCSTPDAVFTEGLLIQTFFTMLITADDEHINYSSANRLPKHLILAKNIIESKYYEPLSLDILQSQVKVNKHQLCRDFTKYLGQPPLKYLNHYRIDKAATLLITTDDTIHSIGETVGITNTTHFINLFKTQTGLTPQQYRNVYSISSG